MHAVLRHAPADMRGGTLLQHPRVLVATVAYQENPHLCLHILHAAKFQVSRGAYILLRVLADTKSQEAQGLLEEIRRQSSVSVLSGPAIVITNIATASVCLAKGWSTESVRRVVRTARTAREIHEKERAEHAYFSDIHDEVTRRFSSHISENLMKMKISQKTQKHRMTRKTKQNCPCLKHCRHGDRFRRFMQIWDTHQIARWYECFVSANQAQIHPGRLRQQTGELAQERSMTMRRIALQASMALDHKCRWKRALHHAAKQRGDQRFLAPECSNQQHVGHGLDCIPWFCGQVCTIPGTIVYTLRNT